MTPDAYCRPLSVLRIAICVFLGTGFLNVAAAEEARRAPGIPKDTLPRVIDINHIPSGLSSKRLIPRDNPLTPERVALGRRLFFEGRLSRSGKLACASCHQPEHGFASPDAKAVGVDGQVGKRNAPSLLNRAYGRSHFWDGRAASLEEQALKPIANSVELGSNVETVLSKLRQDASYPALFAKAFGRPQASKVDPRQYVTAANLAKALAGFQRTLLFGDTPVDRFRSADAKALSDDERQGLWLFESKARCWKCHSGNDFSDEKFHNTGVSWGSKDADLGRFFKTGNERDVGAFKTPTLRGVALTAPYMHDGSLKTLTDVVEFYNRGGTKNPALDPAMEPLHLSKTEVAQLVAFLNALSRTADPKSVLPPGKPEKNTNTGRKRSRR